MGFAIAEALAAAGADVELVTGPTSLQPENKNIQVHRVTTANEMFEMCRNHVKKCTVAVFSAAVADFTPEIQAAEKIKRVGDDLTIRLKPTTDIAGELGKQKRADQFFVGFALETNDALEHARGKLKRKNLDMIVMNSLEDEGAGFGTETNKITIIDKSGNIDTFGLKMKSEVARDIVEKILKTMSDA